MIERGIEVGKPGAQEMAFYEACLMHGIGYPALHEIAERFQIGVTVSIWDLSRLCACKPVNNVHNEAFLDARTSVLYRLSGGHR